MRVSVKVALLIGALSGMATVGEYSLLSAAHASTGTQNKSTGAEALRRHVAMTENASLVKVTKTRTVRVKDSDDYDSYVEVFQEIDEDPEHVQAKMITPSYDINN